MTKEITIKVHLEQVCNDVLVKCNLISKGVRDEALADIRAAVSTPDDDETRSIICRAITEAIGNVKYIAQRYMTTGRTTDCNQLERLVSGVSEDGAPIYETIVMTMRIPNFNTSVTDALKSHIHKYVIDYTMHRFLQDLLPEKSGEYKTLAEDEDYANIGSCLQAREVWTERRPNFA